jgi:ketosteroid isomerase-like protein
MEDRNQNIANLQRAYQLWNDTRGGSVDEWKKLLSDDDEVHPPGGLDAGSGFFQKCCGKVAADAYFSSLAADWELIYFIPEEFIAEGDRVVVLSRAAFRSRATGKTAESYKADVFRFRDGAIAEFRDFFDTAGVLAAQAAD